jgi:hypothetical protein
MEVGKCLELGDVKTTLDPRFKKTNLQTSTLCRQGLQEGNGSCVAGRFPVQRVALAHTRSDLARRSGGGLDG